jgi:uncharacterized protein involved in tolerance to divalent cations
LGIDASGNATVGSKTSNKYLSLFSNNVEGARLATNYDLLVKNDVIAFSTTLSDARLKENVQRLSGEEILAKVLQILPSTYEWTEEVGREGREYGVIAQEIEKLFPEIVYTKEEMLGISGPVKVVDYTRLAIFAISAIQELYKQMQQFRK